MHDEEPGSTARAAGTFGHHPDPSTDLCVEVEMLEGWIQDIAAGLRSEWPFWGHLSRVLRFCRTRSTELDCVATKAAAVARDLERRLLTAPRQPTMLDPRHCPGVRFAR